MVARFVLLALLGSLLVAALPPGSAPFDATTASEGFGRLRLCPPGGQLFLEAFQLACPMRRKRSAPRPVVQGRSRFQLAEPGRADEPERARPWPGQAPQTQPADLRPPTMAEFMQICCFAGCELRDFLDFCSPWLVRLAHQNSTAF